MSEDYRAYRRDLSDVVWRIAHDATRLAESILALDLLGAAPEAPDDYREIDAEFAVRRGIVRAQAALNRLDGLRDRVAATIVATE